MLTVEINSTKSSRFSFHFSPSAAFFYNSIRGLHFFFDMLCPS